jgi:hypothetical protein
MDVINEYSSKIFYILQLLGQKILDYFVNHPTISFTLCAIFIGVTWLIEELNSTR